MFSQFKHLLCFVLPLNTWLFLITTPHDMLDALAWTLPFWLILYLDWLNLNFHSLHAKTRFPKLYFDGILYALVILQIANIGLMLQYVSQLPWLTGADWLTGIVNLIVIRFLVGTSSGTSGIVVAHELIHRPQLSWQILGRMLLCTVGYEHFAIAHQRSHHQHLGATDDITTAKLGESFKDYWQRVRFSYLAYAWRSEQERLASSNPQHKIMNNETLLGLLSEFTLVILIIIYFGWLAAVMFVYQAVAAVRILEAVNYFQHWGLESRRFGDSYGWVTRSAISRYVLLGLSHHIGHHRDEHKQFYEIPYSHQGPLLPHGYFVMNLWVKLNNASFQKMALQQLHAFQQAQSRIKQAV